MPDWKLWRDMANESMKAAREIQNSHPRSAVSRFYYGAYQLATAYLLYRRLQPPEPREAWSHADTPQLLKENLGATVKAKDKIKDLSNRLRKFYKVGLDADYISGVQVANIIAERARKDAG